MTVSLAFGQTKSELCKKWTIDMDAVLQDLPPEMTAMFEMLPAEQKKMAMDQMTASLKELWVEFKSDGSLEANGDNGMQTGSWKFIDGNKAVFTKVGEEESEMEFVEFSGDKMKIKQRNLPEGQPNMVLTFIPWSE